MSTSSCWGGLADGEGREGVVAVAFFLIPLFFPSPLLYLPPHRSLLPLDSVRRAVSQYYNTIPLGGLSLLHLSVSLARAAQEKKNVEMRTKETRSYKHTKKGNDGENRGMLCEFRKRERLEGIVTTEKNGEGEKASSDRDRMDLQTLLLLLRHERLLLVNINDRHGALCLDRLSRRKSRIERSVFSPGASE